MPFAKIKFSRKFPDLQYIIKIEPPLFQNIMRISMVMMTGFVVLIIPSFSNIMALVGATCCTLLAFTLPGLFHMAIMRG